MQYTYAPFADRMIKRYEGGYGWNRKDTGGPTKYGITCFDLAAHMGKTMDSMSNWAPIVQAMTLATAEEIYRKKYATAVRYDDLPAGIDVEMFDYGVNSGTSRPIHVARKILLGNAGSGVMDAALLKALQNTDPHKFIDSMSDERLTFMHAIRGGSAWAEFGKGWGARVADLRAYAHHLEGGIKTAPATASKGPDLSDVPTPKAQHGDPNLVTKTVKGTIGAAVPANGGGALSGVPVELLLIGTGFIIVGGVAYVLYQRAKAAKANASVILPKPGQPILLQGNSPFVPQQPLDFSKPVPQTLVPDAPIVLVPGPVTISGVPSPDLTAALAALSQATHPTK